MVQNATLDLVELLLQEVLNESPELFTCTCDQCLDDIRAFTLNRLPAAYFTTDSGQAFTGFRNFEPQQRADALAELTKSIQFVGTNKRHE